MHRTPMTLAAVALLLITCASLTRAQVAGTPNQPMEIMFTVGMSRPHTHLLEVDIEIKRSVAGPAEELLKMPVWTPGSYLVREFERHLQDFTAADAAGQALKWEKLDKNTWRITTNGARDWHATYRVYANELSVRTSELNSGHALVALACKESEWEARERQSKLPVGRPRLLTADGQERLLDDGLAEALPVWSPDSSKVATAFDTDVAIYDAATDKPTQARLPLRDQLIAASVVYEQRAGAKKAQQGNKGNSGASPVTSTTPAPQSSSPGVPASFNPIVRLEWPSPERLYFQTAYILMLPNEPLITFPRWHVLQLSAQAAVLK